MDYKNKIKLFFFDLDSTTYDHNEDCVRESTYEGLRKLKENGYKIFLNTSRAFNELTNAPKDFLELFDGLILLSGAYVIKEGQVQTKILRKELVDTLSVMFEEKGITYRYCTPDGLGYLNKHDEDKENLFKRLYDMIPPIKKYEGEEVIGILFYADQDIKKEAFALLNDEMFANLRIAAEIYPANCDKGLAMLDVAKQYGYTYENCCAFGDSNNDLSMCEKVGLSVALKKCSEDLAKTVTYITDDISDDGLYKALKHFEFI